MLNVDEQLCDRVFMALDKKFGERLDLQREPEVARTVTVVYHSLGIIGNGGFRYLLRGYFNGDPGYQFTCEAYRIIGAPNAHAAFARLVSLFPNGELPTDIDECIEMYESLPADQRKQIDEQFWESSHSGEIISALASFIRGNADELHRITGFSIH